MGVPYTAQHWQCHTSQHQLMSWLVALMICRAIKDPRNRPKRLLKMKLNLECTGLSAQAVRHLNRFPGTVQYVLNTMKINFFPQDACTKIIRNIMEAWPDSEHAFANAYVCSVCTGKQFLQAFLDSNAGGQHQLTQKLTTYRCTCLVPKSFGPRASCAASTKRCGGISSKL